MNTRPIRPLLFIVLLIFDFIEGLDLGRIVAIQESTHPGPSQTLSPMEMDTNLLTLFLCGDVMTGRGIDQALPHPGNPRLYESYVKNAKEYLVLAQEKNGPIDFPVTFDYIWGDALVELQRKQPDLRIINLETSITTSDDPWAGKVVNYRMHPGNTPCLTAAGIDGCALANNHVLDWGYRGLTETLEMLVAAGIKTAGAGPNETEAARPAIWQVEKGRVIFFSAGSLYSGVPEEWKATALESGINFLEDFSDRTIEKIKSQVEAVKRPNDVVLFSIHWDANWGYDISPVYQNFARRLIDKAGVDLIHGHSSHHFKGIEVYGGKLILYGCGDFINDYEGIEGKEEYRGDLRLMYFPVVDHATGRLIQLEVTPLIMRNFRLQRVVEKDARWVEEVLNRKGAKLGTGVRRVGKGGFQLTWK